MRVFRVLVPVRDIEEAAAFYATVLGTRGERVSAGRHYYQCGSVVFACVDPGMEGDDYEATPNVEPVYFAVDDLDSVARHAQEAGASFSLHTVPGVGIPGEIQERPWGERSIYFCDPSGNSLCFVQAETVFTGAS